jgi:excisionase family DNA binding protein
MTNDTNDTPTAEDKLTVPQAAKYLEVSPATVWRLVSTKKLPSWRTNQRNTRIRRADLDRYIQDLNATSEPTEDRA